MSDGSAQGTSTELSEGQSADAVAGYAASLSALVLGTTLVALLLGMLVASDTVHSVAADIFRSGAGVSHGAAMTTSSHRSQDHGLLETGDRSWVQRRERTILQQRRHSISVEEQARTALQRS